MPRFSPSKIRTVALLGHSHEGKTSLAEAMLHVTGAVERLGRAEAGTTVMDFEPEESRRHMSINLACAHTVVDGVKLNLLDTPGFFDFASDARHAVAVSDAALIVTAPGDHLSVGTELAWELARHRPRIVAINKLDKENASFETTLAALRAELTPKPVAVCLPIGSESRFNGVVDLMNDRAYTYDSGGRTSEVPIPDDMAAAVEQARADLAEAAAEGDDELLEKYLEGATLSIEEIHRGLHEGTAAGRVIPVFPVSATHLVGVAQLVQDLLELVPSPEETASLPIVAGESGEANPVTCDPEAPALAVVFKTTADPFVGRLSYFKVVRGQVRSESHLHNVQRRADERISHAGCPRGKAHEAQEAIGAGDVGVVAKLQHTQTGDSLAARESPAVVKLPDPAEPGFVMAIEPANRADEAKIGPALQHLLEEDSGLRIDHDEMTRQTLIRGFGDVQLEVACEKLKRKFGVEAVLHPPRVSFTETVAGSARAEKKYKKQSGGAGMYGHCVIEVGPAARGQGFVWEDRIFGGSIPQPLRPSVERGVKETMEAGVISGNPVVDVKVSLVDGSTHPVDGKDMAFRLAGAMAMREAVTKANPVLLEPIMELHVVVPDRYMGEVMSDVTGRRGRIVGTSQLGDGRTEVIAHVPHLELLRYSLDLRSMTQGRGSFHLQPAHREELPATLAAPIMSAWQKEHPHGAEE